MNIIIKAKKVNNAKNLNKNTKYITRWVKNNISKASLKRCVLNKD